MVFHFVPKYKHHFLLVFNGKSLYMQGQSGTIFFAQKIVAYHSIHGPQLRNYLVCFESPSFGIPYY